LPQPDATDAGDVIKAYPVFNIGIQSILILTPCTGQ
jgi:hypothetical protein